MDHRSQRPSRALRVRRIVSLAGVTGLLGLGIHAVAQDGYRDTPLIPGSKWRVHDADRPQPRPVDPGTASTPDAAGKAPSDAVVLFDGKDMSKWKDGKGNIPSWKVENGYVEVTQGGGSITTRDQFGDCQLHVEFATPTPPKGTGQNRGNSGIFLFDGRYEVQVLDSFESRTYADGGASALYGQYPPLVNACRAPGEWQTYDIFFQAPRFDGDNLISPAYITVVLNGVLLHHHRSLQGPTLHRKTTSYDTTRESRGPLELQDHGDLVRYRNIWMREIKDYDQE
jgi:hypothetical protein